MAFARRSVIISRFTRACDRASIHARFHCRRIEIRECVCVKVDTRRWRRACNMRRGEHPSRSDR